MRSDTWVIIYVADHGSGLPPLWLGGRCPCLAGLIGGWIFLAVKTIQVATSQQGVVAINNVVLQPMVFCYLGWFVRNSCRNCRARDWSHGVATSVPGDTVNALLSRADRILYASKRQRNV